MVKESGDKSCELQSVSGGRPLKVTLGQLKPQSVLPALTLEDLLTVQVEANLSDR